MKLPTVSNVVDRIMNITQPARRLKRMAQMQAVERSNAQLYKRTSDTVIFEGTLRPIDSEVGPQQILISQNADDAVYRNKDIFVGEVYLPQANVRIPVIGNYINDFLTEARTSTTGIEIFGSLDESLPHKHLNGSSTSLDYITSLYGEFRQRELNNIAFQKEANRLWTGLGTHNLPGRGKYKFNLMLRETNAYRHLG